MVQAVAVVNKFMRKDKITDIQLKFDNGRVVLQFLNLQVKFSTFPRYNAMQFKPI